MRQPRTDREPGPPPAFQQSTHKNQSTSFLSHLPDFGKCKTLSILSDCPDPAGPGAHLSLVSCHSSLTYSALTYSALSPFGAKNKWSADTMPVLHRALILPQCTINVPYFEKDVKGGDFPTVGQIFCSFFENRLFSFVQFPHWIPMFMYDIFLVE